MDDATRERALAQLDKLTQEPAPVEERGRTAVVDVKGPIKSKTIWLGLIVTLLGAVQAWLPTAQAFIPPEMYGLLLAGIGFAVMVLRFFSPAVVRHDA